MKSFQCADKARQRIARGQLRQAARLFQQAAELFENEPHEPGVDHDFATYWEGSAAACDDIADYLQDCLS
jgi:hypothetical protein